MYRKHSNESIQEAVENSTSVRQVLIKLGVKPTGGSHSHISKRIARANIDTSHFLGRGQKGKPASRWLTAKDILVVLPEGSYRAKTHLLRRALLEIGREEICNDCGCLSIWNKKPLTLQVDHIDGNSYNNIGDNLQFLCPNCHSQKTNARVPQR